ncbi:MAG: mycothiol synthase [Corynebacterium sp.]|uniref:mycothiol synthase n=1 Tax=Corynebacterium sp. TaxID=1720 RepID=UPI0026DC5E8B|nr:mycothiol synthase [Corynebacterium sp.]MDO5099011.1 mycothiol synthase [Corynebacterium sp.]
MNVTMHMGQLPPPLYDATKKLLRAALDHDGVPPLSEQFLIGLTDASRGHTHALLFRHTVSEPAQFGNIIGIATSDGNTLEMVVHPDFRRSKGATALKAAFPTTPIWAHGNLPEAQQFAEAFGLTPARELLVMAADITPQEVPPLPTGLTLLNAPEAIERFGQRHFDNQWLIANNQAFNWHPEQGDWDQNRLDAARNTDWYRPEDVLTLWDNDIMLGFHWMKRHGELSEGADAEVYVIGLADAGRGRGLGAILLSAGINHLYDEGARRVILYVESDNAPAVAAYEALGFTTIERHVLYN